MRRERLTYLSEEKLRNIETAVATAADAPGDFLEMGVALGGSAIVIATLMPSDRTFHGYDVFGMIPPTSEHDDEDAQRRYEEIRSGTSEGIDGDLYYGYMDDLYEQVVARFAEYGFPAGSANVQLHGGLFEDTLNPAGPVAFAHIDGDWYESVFVCLDRLGGALSPGGVIVLDDYYDFGGCRRATDQFLAGRPDIEIIERESSLVLQRRVESRPTAR